jgi:hypothetical protein
MTHLDALTRSGRGLLLAFGGGLAPLSASTGPRLNPA